jgi:hypothetical protein
MKYFQKFIVLLSLLAICALCAQGQDTAPAPSTQTECLKGAINDLKNALGAPGTEEEKKAHVSLILRRWFVYVCYLSPVDAIRSQLLGKAEDKRLDKQPGASSSVAGSTSLADKGSAPWLLGFALEHGGLTQSTDGNTITFRGNLVNSIRAMLNGTYLGSYEVGGNDPLVQYLSKLSLGVSFNTGASSGSSGPGFSPSTGTFSGVSARYEIYNHRDPRDKKWSGKWDELSANTGMALARSYTHFDAAVRRNPKKFNDWILSQAATILALSHDALDQQLPAALEEVAKSFAEQFWNLPEVQKALSDLTAGISQYIETEDGVFGEIKRTPIVTLDYSFARQSLPSGKSLAATAPNNGLPDLSTLTMVLEKGFAGGAKAPELTFNASGAWFSIPPVSGGRVRDARATVQFDLPLKEIQNVGRPALSFSAQFLALLEEPLGQKVTLNGVTISRTGNIGVFQTKLSIPIKDSGVKIPIAFTYASRTELVKEKDVRGNIGVTFDLDSLFAKAK